jgi:sporulation protein YlmC with PRC-barrel domain
VEKLLRLPVRIRGIQLGRAVDVVLDRDAARAVGLEIACGDDARRFLPFAVVQLRDDAIELRSPLVLLDATELAFYTSRGVTFRSVRGTAVLVAGDPVGTVADLVLAVDGTIESVVVGAEDARHELPLSSEVAFGPPTRAVRAAS